MKTYAPRKADLEAPWWLVNPDLRIFLAVAVMGGFTTYSSFNHETLALAQRGQWGLASAYVAATLVGAWVAGLAGLLLAQFASSGSSRPPCLTPRRPLGIFRARSGRIAPAPPPSSSLGIPGPFRHIRAIRCRTQESD